MSRGGAERAVYQLIREQRRRAVLADLAVGDRPGMYGERLRQIGADVHELGCRGAWDVVRSSRLTAIARQYEIVHVHGVEPLLIGAVARSGSRLVYTHRGGVRDYGRVKRFRLMLARTGSSADSTRSLATRDKVRAQLRDGLASHLRMCESSTTDSIFHCSNRPVRQLRSRMSFRTGQVGRYLLGTAANLAVLEACRPPP